MDKKAILGAIGSPSVARRAIAALKSDPGVLKLVHVSVDNTLGYSATCCIHHSHHNGDDTYVVMSDFGPVDTGYAMMWTMSMAGRFLDSVGKLDDDFTVFFLTVTSDPGIDDRGNGYLSIRHKVMGTSILEDGSRETKEIDTKGGWWSLIIKDEDKTMEDILQDMESQTHDY